MLHGFKRVVTGLFAL
ncbi:hypothetical protein D039_2881A, partial [Vibrio parahaemolyticus EKP-028]